MQPEQTPGLLSPDHPLAPKYWRNETSGVLATAIMRYLERREALTVRDIALIRAYIVQWIDSPVWEANPHMHDEERCHLTALRREAREVSTVALLDAWIDEALRQGHDPL